MFSGCSKRRFLSTAIGVALAHCSGTSTAQSASPAATVAREGSALRILVVGDSLSAEYGIARGTGWVALLQARLASSGRPTEVLNASISGDTSSGGRARLPALLASHRPQIVIIELGSNDALRGLPLTSTLANLNTMTRAAKDSGAKVLLVGMQVPPNYGRRYSEDFAGLFAKVAKDQDAALVPFLLKGIADVPDAERWFQPDRIHPRAEAHPIILDNLWPVLRTVMGMPPRAQ